MDTDEILGPRDHSGEDRQGPGARGREEVQQGVDVEWLFSG